MNSKIPYELSLAALFLLDYRVREVVPVIYRHFLTAGNRLPCSGALFGRNVSGSKEQITLQQCLLLQASF